MRRILVSDGRVFSFSGIDKIVVVATTLLFILQVFLSLTPSSLEIFNLRYHGQTSADLIFGEPRAIRSDEWVVGTPWMLSQAALGLPIENKNVGPLKTVLIAGLPAKHISVIFKPTQWGFFIFNGDRALAWLYGFRFWGIFLGFYFIAKFFFKGNHFLSFLATTWILFSGFAQWWFTSSLSELLCYFALAGSALGFLIVSSKRTAVIFYGFLFMIMAGGFALTLYPAFQVPLMYVGGALFIPFLLSEPRLKNILKFKLLVLATGVVSVLLILFSFAIELQETVSLVSNTAYPGKRFSQGGGFGILRYFIGAFNHLFTDGYVPKFLGNICEASSFFILWPLALLGAVITPNRERDLIAYGALLSVILLLSIYILFGFPVWLAEITLLKYSFPTRAILGVGVLSIFFVLKIFEESESFENTNRKRVGVIVTVLFSALLGIYLMRTLHQSEPSFASKRILWLSLSGFILLSTSLVVGSRFWLTLFLFIWVFLPGISVNPLQRGLAPIYQNKIVMAVKGLEDLNSSEPLKMVWAVYNDHLVAQLLAANGFSTFNGVRYVLDPELMVKFDRRRKFKDIYNRYAHFSLSLGEKPVFHLLQADLVVLEVSPCHSGMLLSGVNRFLIPKNQPIDLEKFKCLEMIGEAEDFLAYKLKFSG
ncbi:MAG TPA: hypothetical protein PKD37_05635 [Oligoflexia bacterium]|nr:hypothetical protein [Oligoflexia bacterium]HMP27445.1 hypothetical protein [Oligoflexia bacterium]